MSCRSLTRATLVWAAALVLGLPALAQAAPPRVIPGRVIGKYKAAPDTPQRATLRANLHAELHARRYRDFAFIRAEALHLGEGVSVEQALQSARRNPFVEYAEPVYEIQLDLTPNDPRFSELYGMRNTGQTGGTAGADIRATNAWDLFTGDPNLKVGVIDTGIDYNHPDLAANMWTNPGEIAGNGIDDDSNGYIDDIHGYDFVNNDGDPFDDNGHGSHCAGTIAGVGNNGVGVVGVNWSASLIGIKFLSAGGSGSTDGAIASVQYAIAVGARLTSNSWGGGGFSQALLDAINAAGTAGQLFIAAAGNSSSNNDTSPHYPSSYDTPYIIAVAATDHNDGLASFSSYGATSVDLGAPGVDILSCQPGGGYQLLSGTSMATPHVAGATALLLGRFPAMSNLQAKQRLMMFADPVPELAGRCVTGARLNAFMTIADPDSTPPGAVSDLATANPGSNTMGLTWTATGDDGGTGRASAYDLRYSIAPIDPGNFDSATPVAGPDPQPAGSAESFEVGGLDFSTTYFFALKALDEFGNAGPLSNVATGTTLGIPNISASPTSFSATLLTGAQETQTLTLTNTGAGTLDFTIPVPELIFTQGRIYDTLDLPKGAADPRVGDPVVLGRGGPDGFGYRWVDSDEPGGPSFAWVDITGVGTPINLTGDDQTISGLPIGFDFPFYGNTFSTMNVCTNGFLSFTNTTAPYGNQGLPASGGVPNMVAPFWDDLDFRTAGDAYYYNDGSRLIVSWIAAPHYDTGGPYTFQVLLYPSGEIRYQYQTLAPPTNSATVGMQDASETIGLNVAFNTSYLHDGLAVRLFPLQQWLSVSPTSGRIHAGASQELQVEFDATGLNGGDYEGSIHILSNDPDNSPHSLAATLHVIGAPNVSLSPAALDYGEVFVGSTHNRTLTVSNTGTDQLNVSNVATNDPTLVASPTAFSLAPGGSQNVTVTYNPTSPSTLAATITVSSNDPDEPTKTASASGSAVPAPSFAVDPTSFDVTLNSNTATTRNLRVTNNGGSNYVFTAEAIVTSSAGATQIKVYDEDDNIPLEKGEADKQFGPRPDQAGGPDLFGYRYADSNEPGGPAFNWVDISGIGTPINLTGDDQNLGPFPVGFDFPFYGNSFNSFRICTNGFVSFTSTLATYVNTAIPNSGSTVPNNLLAPFWDDFDFRTTGDAYYHNDGSKLIIQYHQAPRFGTAEAGRPNTFEILIYPNGQIVYQYLSIQAATRNSATVGIQNDLRNDGLQVVFNANYITDGLAVRFTPPATYLTVTPNGGTVSPGAFMDLTVGFNAAGLTGGDYTGAVRLAGNDPIVPQLDVPAVLHVIGVPDILNDPDALAYGEVYIGYPQVRQFQIRNVGTDQLTVSEITSDNAAFAADQTNLVVPPGGAAVVNVSFNPPAAQTYAGVLTVKSNDPDSPFTYLSLEGEGLVAPDEGHSPGSWEETMASNTVDAWTLTVTNTGGSDLDFTLGASVNGAAAAIYEEIQLAKEEEDRRPGILASGGPDGFGYRWKDSDEANGPTFNWADITGVGTPINLTGDDQTVTGIPIGFNFPFYGNTFSTVNVCTNGWLSFTSTLAAYSNQPLPNSGSGVPENLLAPFWDDMDFRATGDAYYHNDGSRFIVSWVAAPHYSTGGPYTFQVILYPSGKIIFQYLSMQNPLDSGTIGIQNATRTDGLPVVFNAAYVHDGLAIQFQSLPEWLSVSPASGTIPAGGSMDLQVTMNSTDLDDGTYNGNLRISSNDPDEGSLDVPVTLHVRAPTPTLVSRFEGWTAGDGVDLMWSSQAVGEVVGWNVYRGSSAATAIERVNDSVLPMGEGGEFRLHDRPGVTGTVVYRLTAITRNGDEDEQGTIALEVSTKPQAFAFALGGANPFRGRTTLSYALPEASPVRMRVYNVAGRTERTLVDRVAEAGTYSVPLEVETAGVYLVEIQAGAHRKVLRVVALP